MGQLNRPLEKIASTLMTKIVNTTTSVSIYLEYWRDSKSVIRQPISTVPILYLNCKTKINNPRLLSLLKRVCYTPRDTRAGWFGAAIPDTDLFEFKPLAEWATAHWAMYSGFVPYVQAKRDNGQILDVGCGLGHATACLATVLDTYAVTGVDIDEIAIRFARRFNRASNVRYIQGDFTRFSSYKQYEYIFALEVLEHITAEHHYQFIDKCLSLLANDGLLFLTTPNALEEQDSAHAHIGLLNKTRARTLLEKYKKRIIEGFFYDNRQLSSIDPLKFIIRDSLYMFEDMERNRSHFCLIMR